MTRRERAFTLLELIVVIVVLALLAALAIPTFARVTKTSKLEVAEVSAASLIRDAVALARFDGDVVRGSDVVTAADELPVRVSASGGLLAAGADEVLSGGTRVVFGAWEFSGNPRTISARLLSTSGDLSNARDPGALEGVRVGVAIWVPDAGCAVGVSDDLSGATRTWHHFDDELGASDTLAQANCNGALAFTDPAGDGVLPAGLRPPRKPVIEVVIDSTKRCVTIDFKDDPANFLDVYIGGKYVETVAKPSTSTKAALTCLDRDVTEDDVTVIESAGPAGVKPDGGSPRDGAPGAGPGGSPGGTDSDGSGTLPGAGSAPTGSPAASAPAGAAVVVTLPAGAGSGATVWRGPAGGGAGTVVSAPGSASGGSSHYDTAPAGGGSSWYWWTSPAGSGWLTPSAVSRPAAPPASGVGALRVSVVEGHVRANWGAVEDIPAAPLSGYRLYRGVAATESEARALVAGRALEETRANPAKADTTYLDPEDLRVAWWCYALSAHGPGGDSGKSNTACAEVTPSTPGDGSGDPDDDGTPTPPNAPVLPPDSGSDPGAAHASTCVSTDVNGRSLQTCKGTFPFNGTFGYSLLTHSGVSNANSASVRFRVSSSNTYWLVQSTMSGVNYCNSSIKARSITTTAYQYVNGVLVQSAPVDYSTTSNSCSGSWTSTALRVSAHGSNVVVNGKLFADAHSEPGTATGIWLEAAGNSANSVNYPVGHYTSESSVPAKPVVLVSGSTLSVDRPVDADVVMVMVFVDGKHHADMEVPAFAGTAGAALSANRLSTSLSAVPAGTHAVKVFAVDASGKVSPVTSLSVTLS
jgi:prepilin-type N-terminal cleavage/methylation domain-containing protein